MQLIKLSKNILQFNLKKLNIMKKKKKKRACVEQANSM